MESQWKIDNYEISEKESNGDWKQVVRKTRRRTQECYHGSQCQQIPQRKYWLGEMSQIDQMQCAMKNPWLSKPEVRDYFSKPSFSSRYSGKLLRSEEKEWSIHIKKKKKKQFNFYSSSVQFSSVQSLSCVRLFATPWIAAHQASLSITNSQSLLKLMPIESVMPSNHLILCHPLLLLPPIPPSIRVFSNESTLRMRWPKYWSFSFSISPINTQGLSPSGWTGWISLQSKGL